VSRWRGERGRSWLEDSQDAWHGYALSRADILQANNLTISLDRIDMQSLHFCHGRKGYTTYVHFNL
jgi:hypothetical protein